jgi:hypothetical protein
VETTHDWMGFIVRVIIDSHVPDLPARFRYPDLLDDAGKGGAVQEA